MHLLCRGQGLVQDNTMLCPYLPQAGEDSHCLGSWVDTQCQERGYGKTVPVLARRPPTLPSPPPLLLPSFHPPLHGIPWTRCLGPAAVPAGSTWWLGKERGKDRVGTHVAGHNAENISADLLRITQNTIAVPADISPLRSAATPIQYRPTACKSMMSDRQ